MNQGNDCSDAARRAAKEAFITAKGHGCDAVFVMAIKRGATDTDLHYACHYEGTWPPIAETPIDVVRAILSQGIIDYEGDETPRN